jgi:hypothetical protein
MNRSSVLALVFLLFAALTSCAKEPLKDAGTLGESTLGAVRNLASAYARRDLDGFMERVAPAYPDRDAFRKSVDGVFSTYQSIRFTIQERKMLIESEFKGNIQATFTWEGEWKTSGGKILTDGARVTLVLDAKNFRLLSIEGKDPFLPATTPVPAHQ